MRLRYFALSSAIAVGFVIAGCGGSDDDDLDKAAVAHLAEWVDEPRESFMVVDKRSEVWQNSCLGVVWPGADCTDGDVSGSRIELNSPNGQPHFVHVSDDEEFIWSPIWEVETTIVDISGDVIEFDAGGEFARFGRLVPGTTIVGNLEVGATVFAAETSNIRDEPEAVLVVVVVLSPP